MSRLSSRALIAGLFLFTAAVSLFWNLPGAERKVKAGNDRPPVPLTFDQTGASRYEANRADGAAVNRSLPFALLKQSAAARRWPVATANSGPQSSQDCQQLLQNSAINVNRDGSVDGWLILDERVYVSDQNFVSPSYSLVVVDGDAGDPSPTVDAFDQIFSMPGDLDSVEINYQTATGNANQTDDAFGNLWTVDSTGNPDQFLGGWEIPDSAGTWQKQTLQITDPAQLAPLAGQEIAILFFTRTSNSAPGEENFFDDIELTACDGTTDATATPTATASAPTDTPDPPSNLTARAVSHMQIVLDWDDNSDNEFGFKIEQSLTGTGGWTQIATTRASGHAPPGLNCGTTYYYRVRAYNASGNSPYSNIASDTTFACSAPSQTPTATATTAVPAALIHLPYVANALSLSGTPTATATPTAGPPTSTPTTGPPTNTPTAGPPTSTPTPSPTPTQSPGLKLYLRSDPNRDPSRFLSQQPQSGISSQYFVYPGSSVDWSTSLSGDIQGNAYSFGLYLATSSGSTTFKATILAGNQELASAVFVARSDVYAEFNKSVVGVDPSTLAGDQLTLRISNESGPVGGVLAAPPPNGDSYIIIPEQH